MFISRKRLESRNTTLAPSSRRPGRCRSARRSWRRVAGVVAHLDHFGPSLEAEADQRGHHVGIGVGGLFRQAVPADVRLNPNHRIATDETSQAAQALDCLLGQPDSDLFHFRGGRLGLSSPAGDGHVGGLGRGRLLGQQPLPTQGQHAGSGCRMGQKLSSALLVHRTISFSGEEKSSERSPYHSRNTPLVASFLQRGKAQGGSGKVRTWESAKVRKAPGLRPGGKPEQNSSITISCLISRPVARHSRPHPRAPRSGRLPKGAGKSTPQRGRVSGVNCKAACCARRTASTAFL